MDTTLLSLVGEQPLPVLLPARYLAPERHVLICTALTRAVAGRLQRLLPGSEVQESAAYSLSTLLPLLGRMRASSGKTIVNLTGGTKIMSVAAFVHSAQHGLPFVYLESEQRRSILHHFQFGGGKFQLADAVELPDLITIDDYLRAHLDDFDITGFSRNDDGELTEGGRFEQVIYTALEGKVDEVLAGVRPHGVGDQIDIDLIIRCGNQAGIAEVKIGRGETGPKKGIDQLSTAGAREYLGTYTTRILITANSLPDRVKKLATQHNVCNLVVEWRNRSPYLRADIAQDLVRNIQQIMTGAVLT